MMNSPCPGNTIVDSSSVKMCVLIDSIIWINRACDADFPGPPGNKVSPLNIWACSLLFLIGWTIKQVDPWVCPGVATV